MASSKLLTIPKFRYLPAKILCSEIETNESTKIQPPIPVLHREIDDLRK